MEKKALQELETITANAGYGSEENYDYLEQKELTAYVKYNTFDKEQDKNHQKKDKPFSKENLYYNQEEDYYVCPMGQKMHKKHQNKRTTEAGYQQLQSHYQAKNARVVHYELNVLKPKETEVSKETTILKGTNKEQENYF